MSNAAIEGLSSNDRRRLLAMEKRRRKSGDWGEWDRLPLPNGTGPRVGWGSEVREARKNGVFCVLIRPTNNCSHLAISSLSGIRPTWWEMQRIKNEIAGEDAFAVEIYPPQDEVVDEADMFHIFVCDPLPFGIFNGRKCVE